MTPEPSHGAMAGEASSRLELLASVLKARLGMLIPVALGLGVQVGGGPELAALVLIGFGMVVGAGVDFSTAYAATRLVEVPALAAILRAAPRWMILACVGELFAVYRFFWRTLGDGPFTTWDGAFILAVASVHAAAHGILIAGAAQAVGADARAWAVTWMAATATLVGAFILSLPLVALVAVIVGCVTVLGAASRLNQVSGA